MLRANDESGAHVRLGITRREASLEAPVGFDVYGYGLRDKGGQAMHLSRPRPFVISAAAANSAEDPAFRTGDVIGLHVHLPRRVVDPTRPVFRDRIAIKYKGLLYFECLEYQPTKEMEDLIVPLKKRKIEVEPEVIPGSFIDIYKNGKYIGRAFSDLGAFLPPNSKLHKVTRERRDDSAGHDEDDSTPATSSSSHSTSTRAKTNNSRVSPDDGQLGVTSPPYLCSMVVARGSTLVLISNSRRKTWPCRARWTRPYGPCASATMSRLPKISCRTFLMKFTLRARRRSRYPKKTKQKKRAY